MFSYVFHRSIISIFTACCAVCDQLSVQKKEKRFKKLQSDIQIVEDAEFMTVYRIAYAKWIIEKVGDRRSGKKFKVCMHLLSDFSIIFKNTAFHIFS